MSLGRPHHIQVTLPTEDDENGLVFEKAAQQYIRVEPAGRIFVISALLHVVPKPGVQQATRWTLDTFYVGVQEAVDFVRKLQEGANAKLIPPSEYADAVRNLREATAKIPLW